MPPNKVSNPLKRQAKALREHLLAQVRVPAPPPSQRTHAFEGGRASSPASPQYAHNVDPAIGGGSMMSHSAGESGGDENGSDGKKGSKRELSTSKRAAQNRAAQRAFRQRKEGHIKKLEEQVRDYSLLSENYKALQAENYQLRDYIINLQSRLIESQGDYPQPPSNIDLPHPRSSEPMGHHHVPAPTASMTPSAISQLQASAAQAVADLRTPGSQRAGGNDYGPGVDVKIQNPTDPQLVAPSAGPDGLYTPS
ncbi:MAG: hypothetical protein Q9187_001389 [Circinaria calcarea]